MNSRYAFMSSANTQVIGNAWVFDPGLTNNRPPYEIVELIEGSIVLNTIKNQIVLKSDLQPSNYYSNDNTNIAMGLLHYSSTYEADPGPPGVNLYRYELSDSEKPKYQVSNLRPFKLLAYGLDGTEITPPDATSFMFIFKISYPEQGSITRDYVKSIPKEL